MSWFKLCIHFYMLKKRPESHKLASVEAWQGNIKEITGTLVTWMIHRLYVVSPWKNIRCIHPHFYEFVPGNLLIDTTLDKEPQTHEVLYSEAIKQKCSLIKYKKVRISIFSSVSCIECIEIFILLDIRFI